MSDGGGVDTAKSRPFTPAPAQAAPPTKPASATARAASGPPAALGNAAAVRAAAAATGGAAPAAPPGGLGNAAAVRAAGRAARRPATGKHSQTHRAPGRAKAKKSIVTWEEAWQVLDAIADIVNQFVEVRQGLAYRLDVPSAHKNVPARWQPLLHEWWMITSGTVEYPGGMRVSYRGKDLAVHIDAAVAETAPLVEALLAEGDANTRPWLEENYTARVTEFRTRAANEEARERAARRALRQPYVEAVKELRELVVRKQAVLAGTEPETALPEIHERIEEIGVELREMGVRLETTEIVDRLAADPSANLLRVTGQIVRTPPGPFYRGKKLQFQAVLDYVPPGRLVEYAWRWRPKGSSAEYLFYTGRRGSDDRLDLGSGFWTGTAHDIERAGGMEVFVRVYLGKEERETLPLEPVVIELTGPHPESYRLKASQTVTIPEVQVTFEFAEWAPELGEYWIDWDIDGQRVADDQLVLNRRFTTVGTHTVTARVNRRGDTFFRSRGEHVADPGITVQVEDPEQQAARMLGLMTGPMAPPGTKQLEASLERSIAEIERHVAEGGEQRDYWAQRLEAQRKQLARLREEIPDLATAEELPGDPGALKAGRLYSGPLKAVLILPAGGGPQQLSIHLAAWSEGGTWRARLIDLTSADVYARDGAGTTPVAAYEEAFRRWIDNHPYPRGAKVRYRFAPPGWSLPTIFKCRDTPWETVKAWVDGILTVGGIVVGGLLLLTPEPTGATKALGSMFLAASVARSGVAIYENLQLGIDPLDARNVIEGLSIITSVLGVGGSLLRRYGIRTISPLVYRVGSWTVMASLATDLGTMAFVGSEALAQLRAVQADPTKSDAEKNAEWLRVATQLFASGAMFLVTNKDLIKQGIRPSDFVRLDPRVGASGAKSLSTGSRLDLALELKKVGDLHTAGRVSTGKISDAELLDRHASLPWLRSGAPEDVAQVARRLSPEALVAVQDVAVQDVRAALGQIGDDAAVNAVAAKLKGAGVVGVAPTVAKIRKLRPGTKVEIRPDGQLRLDGVVTLGSGKLATLGDDRALKDLLRATAALKDAGSLEALRAKDPAAARIMQQTHPMGAAELAANEAAANEAAPAAKPAAGKPRKTASGKTTGRAAEPPEPIPDEAKVAQCQGEVRAINDEIAELRKQRRDAEAKRINEKPALLKTSRAKSDEADALDRRARVASDPKERAALEQRAKEARAEWEAAREQQVSNQDEVDGLNRDIADAQERLSEAELNLKLAKAGSRLSDTKAVTDRLQSIVDEVAESYDSGKLGPHPGDARAVKSGKMTPEVARGLAIDKEVKKRIAADPDLEGLKTTPRGSEGVDIYDDFGRKWDMTTPEEWKKGEHKASYGKDTQPLFTRPPKGP